jgi:hypothetical protein
LNLSIKNFQKKCAHYLLRLLLPPPLRELPLELLLLPELLELPEEEDELPLLRYEELEELLDEELCDRDDEEELSRYEDDAGGV